MRKFFANLIAWMILPGFVLILLIAPNMIVELTHAQSPKPRPVSTVEYHDAEPLIGCVGCIISYGSNDMFRIGTMPKPELSLILVSDRRVLTPGIDYTLRNDGLVQIIEVKAIPHDTLLAWYRVEK